MKLVVLERESESLRKWLGAQPAMVSSALARVEVSRAVRRVGMPAGVTAGVLSSIALLGIDPSVLARATELDPPTLRSLDAIHVATALHAGIASFVTYDERMVAAARGAGLSVVSPA